MRYPRPRQPRPHVPIHNPQLQRLNDNVNTEEHRRKQILRQLTVNAAHLDTPALLLLEGFLQATTTAEQIDMHLSVTGVRGCELFSVRETLLQGKSINMRRVRFEAQAAITQDTTSTLQYRKANIDRTRPPSEETQKMREMLITYLEEKRYKVRTNKNRLDVINHLHAEEVGACDVLHVSDSYGVQGYNGFTTTNHCGLALPGAYLSVIQGVAERLCQEYAPQVSFVVAQGGTNDFLRIHDQMVDQKERQNTPLETKYVEQRAVKFAMNVKWDTTEVHKTRPNVTFVVVAPLMVHMPDVTLSRDRKALLLEMFNQAAASLMEDRDRKKFTNFNIISLPGVWYLGPDEVHLRPYQTPLMFYRIQEQLQTKFNLQNEFIDSPRAVATYYIRGDRAFRRIANLRDDAERSATMWNNDQEELNAVKLAMTPKRSKSMDACQLPTLCTELTQGNKGMLNEWTATERLGNCIGSKRPDTAIPPFCPARSGLLERTLINSFLDFERTLQDNEFHIMMARPLKEVLSQDRVTLNDIENIQAKILDNEGWRAYIEQQEQEQSTKVHFEPVQAPTGRSRSKLKESNLTYMDLPYKDWVWMTVLFDNFEQGPNAFWNALTKFNEAEYETMFLLLETVTIKYICKGKMGMTQVGQRKSTLRGKTIKWIRELIQATGGGVCQAELELMSGLHVSHRSTILGNTHITMLQGRKKSGTLKHSTLMEKGRASNSISTTIPGWYSLPTRERVQTCRGFTSDILGERRITG